MAAVDQRPGIRPRPTIGRRLDIAARCSFPAIVTILLMLLTQAPWSIPGQAALLPAVALCCVWFWSLFRPAAMPPPVVFVIGALTDLLGYLPLGAGIFTLLATHGLALAMRRSLSRSGFAWIWLVFAGVVSVAMLVMWLLTMLLAFRPFSPQPLMFVGVLSVSLFPLLAVPFAAAHKSIANPDQA
ncbi:MAG TPA: hypothetical protein VHO91_07495 [Rhodopila sp.]|nr:hypothetical protein [Rhodopila sp.]